MNKQEYTEVAPYEILDEYYKNSFDAVKYIVDNIGGSDNYLTVVLTLPSNVYYLRPIAFLGIIFGSHYNAAEAEQKISNGLAIMQKCRYEIISAINIIEYRAYKGDVYLDKFNRDYIEEVDSVIETYKTKMDALRYELEVEQIEKHNKTYWLPYALTALSIIATVLIATIPTCNSDKSDKLKLIIEKEIPVHILSPLSDDSLDSQGSDSSTLVVAP